MELTTEQAASSAERGKRIRQIREFLRLSRKDMEIKYGIPAASIQNWEDARYGGLSEKGAKRLAQAFYAAGANCDWQWLWSGRGHDPLRTINNSLTLAKQGFQAAPVAEPIKEELRLFHQLHPDAIDTIVADDGMMPCVMFGDYVAGQRYYGRDIKKAVGHICIVQTTEGKLLVRKLERGSVPDSYKLVCVNPLTSIKETSIDNILLGSAAPVVWIRRQLSNSK